MYGYKQTKAAICWKSSGEDIFSKEKRVSFRVVPDGEFRTYEIDMTQSPSWTKSITGIRLDLGAREPGGYVDIAYVGVYPLDDTSKADGLELSKK